MKQLDVAKLKQKIGFYPHDGQKEVLKNLGRFTIVNSGKRWGKSSLAAYLALKELFLLRRNVWVVAPNHDLASRVWDYLGEWIDLNFEDVFEVNRHDRIVTNKYTGSKLLTKTGENPTSLLGKGLDLLIVDEASRMDAGIWEGYLRPNLMDRQGRALLISNPFGYNWFYDVYLKGTEEGRLENPEYVSFTFPTAIEDINGEVIDSYNPSRVRVEELRSIKKSTPLDVWRVEYLGQFQEGAGQRFKGYEKCIDNAIAIADPNEWFEPAIAGHIYSIGMDIAKVEDFTCITVIDRMNHRIVGFYRVNGVSWEFMRYKAKDISNMYHGAEITLDASGNGGDIFSEDLQAMGVAVANFKYTNKTKTQLIDKLAILMERAKISFPRIPQLIYEIKSFTYKISNSGNLIYGSSKKDDCVNSLALACWELGDEPLDNFSFSDLPYFPKRRSFN